MISLIIEDRATAAVDRLAALLDDRQELHQVLADSALPTVQQQFVALAQTEHNKLGAPSSGFWNRMLSGTTATGTPEHGTVDAPREAVMRWRGDEHHKAVNHRFMTLPARAEAYNRAACDFTLKFAVLPQGGPVLLLAENRYRAIARGARKGQVVEAAKGQQATMGEGVVMYWLREEVNIPPTPEVMPDAAVLSAALQRGAASYLRRRT